MLIGWHVDAIGAQLNVTWLDSSTNETGFALERSTGTTGAFAEITRTGPGVTAYTDSSVANATTYCYRVRAFNAVAYSDYSNLACGTPAQFFGLAVVKSGLGNGTVTSMPAGINCGTSCSGSYASGTAVTLTAAPATGSTFTGWSGGGCTGTGTCTVTVTAATTVTATFTLPSFTLTVSKAGTGSGTVTSAPAGISCGATCAASYLSGTAVTLTAAPATGSTFTGWSGGGCSGTSTCTVTLTAATTVTATFKLQVAVTLSVSKAGTGSGTVTSTPTGISCGATCSWGYVSGTAVTLTASPATGSTFTGWSGGGCSGSGSCTVTVTGATIVTATFALQAVTLTVSKAGAGSGTVTSTPTGISCGTTCSWAYPSGTAVTLAATAATGSTFTGWSGGCAGTGACSVTLTAATTVTATFASVPPPGATPTTVAIKAPTVTYNTNAVVTVTVSAATGTPSGMVSLVVDNGTPLTATLSNGQAQFILTSPSVGDHTLQASYAAQGGFAASSATGTLHVNGSGVYFSSATYNVNSGSTTATITVLRSGSTQANITVNYATSDGTAHAGVDYVATSGTLAFKDGATKKTFKVQILGSALTVPKTVNLTLSNPSSGSALGAPSTALLTLLTASSGGTGTGLVAAYGFNEGSGTTSADGSGNGHTATLVGGPSWVAGQFGAALSFNGSSSYATTGLTTNLPNWTISGWVRSPAAPTTGAPSGPVHREANYQIDWNHTDAAFRGAAAVRVGGAWYAASFGALAANTWYYLAATYDGETLTAYTNGVLVTSNPAPFGPPDADPNALTIGRHAVYNQFFQGIVDNVRIYNRALSGAEIQQDMNIPL